MEPFGDSWKVIKGHKLSFSCPKPMTSSMTGQMAAKCCPDDHCYVGLFSRPNSDESIIRSEEIHKHCRLKVMLANILIAWSLIVDCPYDMVGPQSSGGVAPGRARGRYSPLSEATCPPVSEEILGFCWRKFGKMIYKSCIFSHFSPPVGSSYPPSEDFWRHPCLKVDLSLKFQEVFTTQVAHGNFKQSCRWYGIPMHGIIKLF